MAEVRITKYRATWDPVGHRGTIQIQTGGDGGAVKEFALTDAGEFAAVSNLLQLDGDVWLVDDRLITTKAQPPGVHVTP